VLFIKKREHPSSHSIGYNISIKLDFIWLQCKTKIRFCWFCFLIKLPF